MHSLCEQLDAALEDERLRDAWVSASLRVAITSAPIAWDSRDGSAAVALQPRTLISATFGGTRGEHEGAGVFRVGIEPGERAAVRRVLEQLAAAGARGEVTLVGVQRTVTQPYTQSRPERSEPRQVLGHLADGRPVYAAD